MANLYYNQPILNRIADSFEVTFEKASSIATLMQAGYAAGLLLICPLGDLFRRRPFILGLIAFTATLVRIGGPSDVAGRASGSKLIDDSGWVCV